MIRILLITGRAERPAVLEQLRGCMGGRAVEVVTASSVVDAEQRRAGIDCVLLWAGTDTPHTIESLGQLMTSFRGTPVIVLTDVAEPSIEPELMRLGVRDYLTEVDLRDGRLMRSVAYAVARGRPDPHLPNGDDHYRSIVEALRDAVIVQSGDGTILSMNRRAAEIFGLPADSQTGPGLGDLNWLPRDVHGRQLTPEERPGYRCFTTGRPVRNQLLQTVLQDGTQAWVEASSYPLRHADEAPHGVVTVLRDVSEQHAHEDSIRFQALLLDAVGQAVIATDLCGRIMHWNQTAELIFGWPARDVLGLDILTVTSFGPPGVAERVMAGAAEGDAWTGELTSRRRDGTIFPMLVTNTPIRDAAGTITGMVGVVTDISERMESEASNRQFSDIVESSSDAIYGTDLDGVITSWNGGAERLYGYAADEALGRDVKMLYPDDLAAEQDGVLRMMRSGRSYHAQDTVRRRRDGSVVEVSVKVSPVVDASGKPTATAAIARDITDRNTMERRLASERDQLAAAQRIAKMGSFELDLRTGRQVWSAELYRVLGVDPATVPSDAVYMSAVHPDDREELQLAIEASVRERRNLGETEHRVALADGTIRWVTTRADLKSDRRIVGAVLDITERKLAQDALVHQSLHDALTGLPNRTMLEQRLATIATSRGQHCAAVLYLDVDRFKVINDGLGHSAGDDLIVAIGQRLCQWATHHDTVARFGSDEFVILCEQVGSMAHAIERAEELVELCEAAFAVGDRQLLVTVSIGVAEVPANGDVENVLGEADAAMYSAKARGRARVVVADQALRSRATARMELESELRAAVERHEFCLHYQPVVDLVTEDVTGYEALVRWNHPTRGLIYPDAFIALAEETGLIVPIGRWALRQALIQLTTWRTQSSAMDNRFVAVNLSTVQLYDASLADQVSTILAETVIQPRWLHLEITETALMDIERATTTLTALKAIGVDIDLDDFGTGYSSLSYLRQLPIDTIKIDRSFVNGLCPGTQDSSIVAAILSLGEVLGLRVLAEGVETASQRDHLRQLGCDSAQGFFWSRPLPAHMVLAFDSPAHPRGHVFV